MAATKAPQPLTEFSKPVVTQLCAEIETILKPFAAAYGITLHFRGGGFNAATFTVKVHGEIQSSKAARQQSEWNSMCPLYHLAKEDLDRTFQVKGVGYRVTGLNPASDKYPIACLRVKGQKSFSFPVDQVRLALHPDKAAAIAVEQQSQAQQDWNNLCKMFGFESGDFGREFTHRGQQYTIAGLQPSARQNPILCQASGTGKTYRFHAGDVLRLLGKPLPNVQLSD